MVRRMVMLVMVLTFALTGLAYAASVSNSDYPRGVTDANGKGYSAGDSLLPQAADTSIVFNIKNMDRISAWVQADCDSTTIAIQTSMDGTVWKTFLSATHFGGTKGTVTCIFHKYLNLTGATGTDYGPVHLGNQLRIICKNNDALATNNGASSRSGVKSLKYYLQGTVL